ncbi:MAG: DUF885 domain-containing protein [Saprospiraceae bacterium]
MRYYVLLLTCTIALLSCRKADSVDNYISIYQAFQDTLSSRSKGDWAIETDSIRDAKKVLYKSLIPGLEKLDSSQMSMDDYINKELLILEIENELNEIEFENYLLPLNSEGGFLAGIVFTIQYASTKTKKDQEKYIKKLHGLPGYLAAYQKILQKGIMKGKTSPNIITQRCIDLIQPYTTLANEDNIFTQPCGNHDSLKMVVETILKSEIIPAYTSFSKFLKDEYLPASKIKAGVSNLVGGKKYYENKVRYYTTLTMSPDEVFEIGKSEVARIKKDMLEVIDEVGFKGSFDEFIAFLRKDPRFYVQTPQDLLNRAAWISKRMEGKLPQYFNILPRMPFTIEPVPSAIAPNYTGGRYSEGSYSEGKAGAYWVNTYKLESRPIYVLPSLTLHEAVPGHHLQIMLSRELKNVPKFRENLYISAFGEGWGLYSEFLGIEAGMYETPYENFGRMTYEMWRACRLVVDVGLHYKGWTREQAVEFMASNTALSMHEVNTEIDRYIGWPGQAVSYKIGEIKIRELRKRAEKELGDKFDIKAFHDLVLSKGSVKLSTLNRLVNDWIRVCKVKMNEKK